MSSGWATGCLGAADQRPRRPDAGVDKRARAEPGGQHRALEPDSPSSSGGAGPPGHQGSRPRPPRGWGGAAPSPAPPPARSRTSLEPVPYKRSAGRGRASRHCSTETRAPPPARDPGQGRGAHFLYLAGLDPILSRGGFQSPTSPHSPPGPGSGPSGLAWDPLFPHLSQSRPLSSVLRVCLCLRPALLVSPFCAPVCAVLFGSVQPSLPVSPDLHSLLPALPGRSHRKDQTLSYAFLVPPVNPT